MLLLSLSISIIGGCRIDCDALRKTQVRSVESDALLKKCAKCLSAEEMQTLQNEKQMYDRVNLPELFGAGKTVQEVLNDDKALRSFDASEILQNVPSTSPSSAQTSAGQTSYGPWVIPESVLFLYTDLPGENGSVFHLPNATGFVLCVPHRKDGTEMQNAFVRFLVTARHVLDPEWAHCAAKNPTSIAIRMNKRAGGVGYETVPLEVDHKRRYLAPEDGTSDVAVLFLDHRLIPNLDSYKFFDVPFRIFPTAAEISALRPSQEIVTAGLMPQFPGDQQNLPILRTGVLSNTPTEAVNVSCDGVKTTPLHTWFITATIPKGVSGAPVFTVTNRGPGAQRAPILLGIQSMAWPDQGVAGMTPSPVLAEFVQGLLQKANFDVDFYRGPEKRSCGGQ
jgi:hypothetical protein